MSMRMDPPLVPPLPPPVSTELELALAELAIAVAATTIALSWDWVRKLFRKELLLLMSWSSCEGPEGTTGGEVVLLAPDC